MRQDEGLLSVGTVAQRLKVCAQTVRNWIRRGHIDYVLLPEGKYRIPASELARLVKINTPTSKSSKHDSA